VGVKSVKVHLASATVGADELELQQGHLLVVIRDGEVGPGPSDWEALLVTDGPRHVRPGTHQVGLSTVDGLRVRGRALVRFSDGHRHLLRGDGDLAGVEDVLG
jgi:hypothetical protein